MDPVTTLAGTLDKYGPWACVAVLCVAVAVIYRQLLLLQAARVDDQRAVTAFVIGVVERQTTLLVQQQESSGAIRRALEAHDGK